jgi:hypothetical protein
MASYFVANKDDLFDGVVACVFLGTGFQFTEGEMTYEVSSCRSSHPNLLTFAGLPSVPLLREGAGGGRSVKG